MAKIKKIQESGTTIYPATITNAVKDPETGKTIPEILKEREEDTYPKMSVGFAENIVGDGSATPEVFSFRPTAGENRNTLNDGAARIQTLKGSSVVVNQIAKVRTNTTTRNGITVTNDGVKSTVVGTAGASETFTNISLATASIAANHKCLLGGCPSNGSASTFYFSDGLGNRDYGQGVIFTTTEAHNNTWMNFTVVQGTTVDFVVYPVLYDLTLMFGAGNEPTTVAEFYQRRPVGLDLAAYNEGEIVDGHYGAIKTTGFNQWDEQWEQGAFDYYTGAKIADNSRIRSKNFIPVIPYTQYYYKMPTSWQVCYWDADKQFLAASQNSTDVAENTPPNCHYITFNVGYSGAPITEYNNDICISLYWPTEYGNLYGTYKPYKPFERDLSWVAKYFPNGMRSAGNVADEIRFNSSTQKWEAVKRIGVVDLGSMAWRRSNDKKTLYTANMDTVIQSVSSGNCTCPKYVGAGYQSVYWAQNDKVICIQIGYVASGVTSVMIKDSAYLDLETFDIAAFKTEMSGVLLNYELAEPIVTEITENVNFDYDVSDYGTEELISDGASAPLSANIVYEPNVLATIKNLPNILARLTQMEAMVSAMAVATTNMNE